jgi:glucose-6-phosphate 1-dehydrogenase
MTIAMGATVMGPEAGTSEPAEMMASHCPGPEEMDAYERVLGDAMAGDATLFARQDYVEEAWRIVDPVLKAGTPIQAYDQGGWGPREADQTVSPPGGWHNPVTSDIRKESKMEMHHAA